MCLGGEPLLVGENPAQQSEMKHILCKHAQNLEASSNAAAYTVPPDSTKDVFEPGIPGRASSRIVKWWPFVS